MKQCIQCILSTNFDSLVGLPGKRWQQCDDGRVRSKFNLDLAGVTANIPCIPCLQWTLYRQLFFTRFWVFNFVLFFTSSVARRVHLQRRFESVVKVFSCLKEMDFSSCRLLFECLHSIWKFRFNRPNRITAVKVSYSCFSTSFPRASNTISFASTTN